MSILSEYRSSLMGFAILYIMFFHLEGHCPYIHSHFFILGNTGVEIFLLLSGLGLYYSLSRENTINIKLFYKKRMLRILPAFWMVIIPLSIINLIKGEIPLGLAITRILGLSAFNEGANGYWYITAILICYIFTPPPCINVLKKQIGAC